MSSIGLFDGLGCDTHERRVDEVLAHAAFERGLGCNTTDADALREALQDAMEQRDALAAEASEVEEAKDRAKEAEAALSCQLTERDRAAGVSCAGTEYDDCMTCQLAAAKREAKAAAEAADDCGLPDKPCIECLLADQERQLRRTLEREHAEALEAHGADRAADESDATKRDIAQLRDALRAAEEARDAAIRDRDVALEAAKVKPARSPRPVALSGALSLDEVFARTLGLDVAPEASPEAQAPTPKRGKIASAAAVRRIPVGTKLRLIRTMMGPCDSGRVFVRATSTDVEMRVDDTTLKTNGEVSTLQLKGSKVEPRDNGFAVLDDGEVCAEYVFA